MPNSPYQPDFWDSFEGDLWDDLANVMLEIYLQGIDGGIAALPANLRVLTDFDQVNTKALEWAKNYRYTFVKGISDTTREQTQKIVSDWIASGAPLDALEASLDKVYGPVRAEMIAQTESTRVYAQANSDAWDASGLVDEVQWNTANDDLVCPICGPLDGTTLSNDDTDKLPPAHVNCRCWITPIVSEDRLNDKLDEVLA